MNGKSMSLPKFRAGRSFLLLASGFAALLASGCVTYRAHVTLTPDGKVDVTESAQAEPGIMDTLHVDPRLAWTSFQATVEGRGGHFEKDRPDSLKGASGRYELDSWTEFGQRGQAFKGIDEGERRVKAPQVSSEVKDQYFFIDTSIGYKQELTSPDNATVDSLALPYAEKATGTLEIEVPGTILTHNAPKKQGNVLTYPLAYGQTVDIKVTYREWQWVSMVSTVLVAIFLGSIGLSAMKNFGKKKKGQQPAA